MKDFGVILVFSLAGFFAVKFFYKWVTGGFNGIAVLEWINRGFAFGIGLAGAFLIVILILRIVVGDK